VGLLQDLKLSLRLLRRTPGFTLAAVAVLALGIGLNTGMFGVVYALTWSPRAFPDPGRVVQFYSQDTQRPDDYRMFSYPVYQRLAARTDVFDGVLAHNLTVAGIGEGQETRRSLSAIVSANYFSVLGVPPVAGRSFTEEEARPGADIPVAVASYPFWKRQGLDPALLGRTIQVNGRAFTVVGILPEGFSGTMTLFGPELYFPLGVFDSLTNDFQGERKRTLEREDVYNLFVVGRVRKDVPRESARAAVAAMGKAVAEAYPESHRHQAFDVNDLARLGTNTSPSHDGPIEALAAVLLGLALAVLLVVCLNLAGMLLARGQARRKEFAVRLALGGGRRRIVRQLLTEGFVLACAGGLAGLGLAAASTRWLMGTLGAVLPLTLFFEGGVSSATVAATLGFCCLATLFFALGPALRLSRADVIGDLKQNAGEDAPARRSRFLPRHPLVVGQLALSLSLLVAAGLFLRMAQKAAALDLGFRADATLVVEVDASLVGYDQARSLELYRRVESRLQALPGVDHAGLGALVPFGMIQIGRSVQRAGPRPAPDARPATAAEGKSFAGRWNAIGSDYFAAMGLPLVRGRAFSDVETMTAGAPPVAILDEALARKLWPDGDALGQRIQWGDEADPDGPGASALQGATFEVVGIVAPARQDFFEKEPGGAVYVPYAQGYMANVHFHVRPRVSTPGGALALVEPVRRELQAAAPGLPVFKLRTFRQHVEASAENWALTTCSRMFSVFAGLALLVATIGLYGNKAYAVSRRTREIGVRVALGALPRAIHAMVLGEGLRTAGVGVTLGLLLGLGVGRVLQSVFVEVDAFDPLVFGGAPLALLAAAALACWISARRATRVAPIVALRSE
jgi:predicted permease